MEGDKQIEDNDDNKQLFGLFNMPAVIRSYEANQFNNAYHQELKRNTENDL